MKSGPILVIVIAVILVALLVRQAYLYATDSPYRISSQEAKHLIQTNKIDLILDVRTIMERKTLGFYPGSVHIPSSDLEAIMPKTYPNKQIRILAYCNTGHRARMATDKLHALGYGNAVYISSTYSSLQ
jgi:rhodanese-related sulfurtransferase